MVVLSQPVALDNHISVIPTYKPVPVLTSHSIPVVDLTHPEAKTFIVKACEEFGFFKVVNHGVCLDLMTQIEQEAVGFFALLSLSKTRPVRLNRTVMVVNGLDQTVTWGGLSISSSMLTFNSRPPKPLPFSVKGH